MIVEVAHSPKLDDEVCQAFQIPPARSSPFIPSQINSLNFDCEEELAHRFQKSCYLEVDSSTTPAKDVDEDEIHVSHQSQLNLQGRQNDSCHEEHRFVRRPTLKKVNSPKMSSRRVSFQASRSNSTGDLFRVDSSENDSGYKNKDLSDYLGMKDQVSKSIAGHQVYFWIVLNQNKSHFIKKLHLQTYYMLLYGFIAISRRQKIISYCKNQHFSETYFVKSQASL